MRALRHSHAPRGVAIATPQGTSEIDQNTSSKTMHVNCKALNCRMSPKMTSRRHPNPPRSPNQTYPNALTDTQRHPKYPNTSKDTQRIIHITQYKHLNPPKSIQLASAYSHPHQNRREVPCNDGLRDLTLERTQSSLLLPPGLTVNSLWPMSSMLESTSPPRCV